MSAAYDEGYDAVVNLIANGFDPTFGLAMNKCPYHLGDPKRREWMDGWNQARSDAP